MGCDSSKTGAQGKKPCGHEAHIYEKKKLQEIPSRKSRLGGENHLVNSRNRLGSSFEGIQGEWESSRVGIPDLGRDVVSRSRGGVRSNVCSGDGRRDWDTSLRN